MSRLRVELEGGKYTFIQHDEGGTEVLRYGEPWRKTTGDKLMLVMAYTVEEQAERIKELEAHVERLRYVLNRAKEYANEFNSNCSGHMTAYRAAVDILKETPSQSLAAVRREAMEAMESACLEEAKSAYPLQGIESIGIEELLHD